MYQFKEQINSVNFFWFSKRLINSGQWAKLTPATKAVFPVVACFADKKGKSFFNEITLGALSGRSAKTARDGIKGLDGFSGFTAKKFVNSRGQWSKKLFTKLPAKNINGKSFNFYKWVIESGIWRELSPTSQALYPVLRCFGFFDIETYTEYEDTDYVDFEELYRSREFDFCFADPKILAEFAGISDRSFHTALVDLNDNDLITTFEDGGCKVFLQSRDNTYFKREYLNGEIEKSFNYEQNQARIDRQKAWKKLP